MLYVNAIIRLRQIKQVLSYRLDKMTRLRLNILELRIQTGRKALNRLRGLLYSILLPKRLMYIINGRILLIRRA